jgi:hypothetical protein
MRYSFLLPLIFLGLAGCVVANPAPAPAPANTTYVTPAPTSTTYTTPTSSTTVVRTP